MTVTTFAEKFGLKTRLDDCGDVIIPGRRGGQLYFDDKLCLMVLDGAKRLASQWDLLHAESLWLGTVSQSPTGRNVQDVMAIGIPESKWKLAIRFANVKPKRVMSEKQAAVLSAARAKSPLNKPPGSE